MPTIHTQKTQPKALINIFISYAHEDKKHCEELVKQLNPVASIIPPGFNIRLLDLWYDDYLLGGDVWDEKIRHHLGNADIILLLISKDFLNSEYCINTELKQAMEMHKANKLRIVPIIIGECKWKATFLGALRALPKDELLPFAHSNPDLFYTNVATEVEAIAKASLKVPPPPWLRKVFNRLKNIHISSRKFITTPKLIAALVTTLFFAYVFLIINPFQPKMYGPDSKRSSCVNSNITNEVLTTYLEQGAYGECLHRTFEADTDADLKNMVSAAELLYEINAKNIKEIQHSVENAKPTSEKFMPLYQQVRGTLYLYKGLHQNSKYLKDALTDFKAAHEGYKNLIYSGLMALALQAGSCSPPAALSEDNEKILIGKIGSLIRKQINKSISTENYADYFDSLNEYADYFDSLNEQLPWYKERPEEKKEHINDKLTQCVDI